MGSIFDSNKAIGSFNGLSEGGLEFGAELTLNYDSSYQNLPMLGQFVLVELERDDEAVLGRITAISSHGRLATSAGEDLSARSVDSKRPIPEDIKRQFLRYKCSVRLLGLLRGNGNRIVFSPSHRRLPHLGAKVCFAEDNVLQRVAGATRDGQPIGFLAFGEFVYAQGHEYASNFSEEFMVMPPTVEPRFDAQAMVARRTCVFARSGFGKSNLLKMLFSRLYEEQPVIERRGKKAPVGTLVLDPDGDYFWPGQGQSAPPGLCDIPKLRNSIVLITDRTHEDAYYQSFKVSIPRLDLRELSPSLVLGCYLTRERLTQRGTEILQRLRRDKWQQLVDTSTVAHQTHNQSLLDDSFIIQICGLTGSSAEAVAGGIRNTMLDLVAKLHSPESQLLETVRQALTDGKLVIVDLSLMRGQPATALSAILLRWLFENNVEENTKAEGRSIPVIALIEEAQKVLEGSVNTNAPFIEWVKEGRKYDLGAVIVTQQPGAIEHEIVSQADNFFVFHLISGKDLISLRSANGHFSEDILATLLNEPIEGQGVFWSSSGSNKTTYPIPFRAYNFGDLYQRLEKGKTASNTPCYAQTLKNSLQPKHIPTVDSIPRPPAESGMKLPSNEDIKDVHRKLAEEIQNSSEDLKSTLQRDVFPLFLVEKWLREEKGRKKGIRDIASSILTCLFGLYGYGWKLENKISKNQKSYLAVVKINVEDGLDRLNNGEDPLIEELSEDS